MDELSDVIEVLEAVAKFHNIPWTEVEMKKAAKRESRGGFEKKIFLRKTREEA